MRNGSDFNGTSFLDMEHLKYLYFSSEGRINRQRIWLGGLVLFLLSIPAYIICGILFAIGSFLTIPAALIFVAVYIVVVIAAIMLQIKRAHVRNHVGWYILLTMIPIIGILFSIELHFLSGTDGPNQYGADPR